MDRKIKLYNIAFYAIAAAGFVFIFFTNPFLVKMYDPWRYHLQSIEQFYNTGTEGGRIWHHMWANIFKLLGINNIFIWAKIIHISQFFLAAFLVYYFSKTVLDILIKSTLNPVSQEGTLEGFTTSGNDGNENYALSTIQIKFLSLFSVFLWFIGNGTFSVQYQQAWIMWYSVTYQGLTIPLFWYATALTLKIVYENLKPKKIIFCIIQIAIVSVIIAKFHPIELLYYLISLPLILLLNIKRIMNMQNRKYPLIAIVVIFIIMFFAVKYFVNNKPDLLVLISSTNSAGQILQKINSLGHRIVKTLNRFPNSFSELAQISLISAVIFRIYYLSVKGMKISFNMNLFDYMLLSSIIFFLIPMVPFPAGLAGYLTVDEQVYRFFYVPPWFIFLPFCLYVIVNGNFKSKISNVISNNTFYRIIKEKEIEIPKRKVIIDFFAVGLVLFMLLAVLHTNAFAIRNSISKMFMFKTTTLNIKSIINSLDKNKVGIQYSQDDMEKRGDNSLK